ncbi:MAG TPA: SPW repeat protein [Candidatus Dormibacteraeota bacterium]|nr:SPW repeat protein [Candidatus Dormibacteraeota bacterium]
MTKGHIYVPWINLALGILVLLSPWVLATAATGAAWNVTITGVVIGVVALIELSMQAKGAANWWPVINILAGIWLLISTAFVRGDPAMIWSNVVMGILAIVTSIVSQVYERELGAAMQSGGTTARV